MKLFNLLITIVFFIPAFSIQAQPASPKHVILIGIGGLSAEDFQYSETPAINSLVAQGVISVKTRGVMPAAGPPNWASILSGAGPEQHGVTNSDWSLFSQGFEPTVKDADGYFPSIFTLIRKQMPKAVTAMFYDQEWLGTYVNKKIISKEQYIQGQVMITSLALNYFKNEKPLFTFIYYGLPDEVGRSKGFGTKYHLQSFREIDTEIGKLITGIQEMGLGKTTAFIVTSNPGSKVPALGAESLSDLEVPWIISGPGIKKNTLLETPNDLMNTAPTIARMLGLKIPVEWIGRPVNEAFSTKANQGKTSQYVPKPWCPLSGGAYPGPQQIELTTTAEGSSVYYTLDGTPPGPGSKKYTSPFTIGNNCTLKAVSVSGKNTSETITRMYTFVQGIKTAALAIQPGPKYPGSGIPGLFDGLIGSSNPDNKQWMGFEGSDFDVAVDLGEVKEVKVLGLDVLQLPANRMFLPSAVEFYASADGKDYILLNTYYPSQTDDLRLDGPVMLTRNFDNLHTRYIRIKAINASSDPSLNSAGETKAWLLVSEVEIE